MSKATVNGILDSRIKFYKRLGNAFGVGLMATTFFFANRFAMQKLGSELPEQVVYLSPYIAIVLALSISYMIDHKLFQSTAESFTAWRESGWIKMPIAGKIMVIFVLIRFAMSTGFTVNTIWFASEAASDKIEEKGHKAAQQVNATSASIRSEQAAIRKDYMSRADKVLAEANAEAKAIVDDAIKAQGANWANKYRSRDEYIMNSVRRDIKAYRKNIEAKKKEAKQIKADARQRYDELINQMDAQIAMLQEGGKTAINLGTTTYERANEKAETTRLIFSSAGWLFDFLFAGMTLLMSVLIAAYCADQSSPIDALNDLFEDEASFTDVASDGVSAAWDIVVSTLAIVSSWFSSGSTRMMSLATSRVADAYDAKRKVKEQYRQARQRRTTQDNNGQQDNSNRTTEEKESSKSKKTKGERQSPPPSTEQETPKTGEQQQDNSGQQQDNTEHRTTGQQKTTVDNTTALERKAQAREARKKLNKKKNAYKTRAKKYLDKAKAAEKIEDRQHYKQLAADTIDKAKEIEIEITNLSDYE
jgi:hypothetical protein